MSYTCKELIKSRSLYCLRHIISNLQQQVSKSIQFYLYPGVDSAMHSNIFGYIPFANPLDRSWSSVPYFLDFFAQPHPCPATERDRTFCHCRTALTPWQALMCFPSLPESEFFIIDFSRLIEALVIVIIPGRAK